ncbi:hypothetical protein HYS47_03285 [Candidatus Woesearchaeota archaeon]|nr:hypothetical protein [Candidatus Woesearchaeota archaeon]
MPKYVVDRKEGLMKSGREYKVKEVDAKASAANPFMGAGGEGLRLVTDLDLSRGHLFSGSIGKDGKVKYVKKA